MTLAEEYIQNVQSGKEICGKYVRLAVQRHVDLQAAAKERGYYFDIKAAKKYTSLFRLMRHTTGEFAGEHFRLSGWQAFIIWVIFGWKKKNNLRLIRKAYIEIAKKNGKTEFAAALAIVMTFFDDEFGAETYIGAKKRAQAAICFKAIKQMVRDLRHDSEYARKLINEPMTWNVNSTATNSKIVPLGKDAMGDQGINAHCGIIDEYHVHPDTEVHDNIESSMVSRTQPLDFIITTAGMNMESPCYKLRKTCTEILEGIKEDDSLFAIIFCFDEGDDWEDETLWRKPIPNLDVSVRLENVQSQSLKAKNEGLAKLMSFKTLNLNMWHASNFETWIPDDVWMKCAGEIDPETLRGRMCFCGLDKAVTSDVAALAYFFPATETGEKHILKLRYYLPEEGIEEKARGDKTSYMEWAQAGIFTLTPGSIIDEEIIKNDIIEDFGTYNVQFLGYDRWNAYGLLVELLKEGIDPEKTAPYGMGYKSLSYPMSKLEEMIKCGELIHGGDPVLRWMVSNVAVETDGENIKPSRKKSTGKIDGVMASIIALGQYFFWLGDEGSNKSIFEKSELWEDEP